MLISSDISAMIHHSTGTTLLPFGFVILLAMPRTGAAQPVPEVTDLEGEVLDGRSLTIRGADFGSGSDAPFLWDDFQSGQVDRDVESTPSAHWAVGSSCDTRRAQYSRVAPRFSGDVGAHQRFGETADCGYVYNQDLLITSIPSTRVFFQGWFWTRTEGKLARNLKPWQFSGHNWGLPQSRLGAMPVSSSLLITVNDVDKDGDTYPDFADSVWGGFDRLHFGEEQYVSLEVVHDDGTPDGNDGFYQASFDGEAHLTYEGTMKSADSPARNEIHVWGYVGVCEAGNDGSCGDDDSLYGPPYPPVDVIWSEVYLDTTWARVQIGNAATYGACTQREIQIPSAWGGDEITVTLNQGAFAGGESAWLFVVDENNRPSPGFPVTFAGQGTGGGGAAAGGAGQGAAGDDAGAEGDGSSCGCRIGPRPFDPRSATALLGCLLLAAGRRRRSAR